MENLDLLVEDLSIEELKNSEGGVVWLAIVGGFLLAGFIYDSISEYSKTATAANAGYSAARNMLK